MNVVLEVLQALASIASIGRLMLDLWREYKHESDGEGR